MDLSDCVYIYIYIYIYMCIAGGAGMVKYIQQGELTGKTMVAVTSGANMDFDRYIAMM